jgi:hypothetical protein
MEGYANERDMDENHQMRLKEWTFIIVLMFMACSSSLYWYGHFSKSKPRPVEDVVRMKWEEDSKKWQEQTNKWQADVTKNVNGLVKSTQDIINVLNANLIAGRLVNPKQETKTK